MGEIRLANAQQSERILSKLQYPSDKLQIMNINKDKLAIWYDTKRKIVYAVDNTVPQIEQTTLFASYDYGETWEEVYSTSYGIKRFYTLESGYHLTFTTNSRVNRLSPDFSKNQMWAGDNISTPLDSDMCIAEKNGVIMFADYGTNDTRIYNVYKSTNDGVDWTVAYEGTDVRHWHSLQIDPYTGYWWLCGGDTDEQSRIVVSKDDGVTWDVLGNGSQNYRSCGLVFFKEEVLWGMDSAATTPKIMKSNKTTWNPVIVGDVPLGATTLGHSKTIDGLALGWTRVEVNSSQKDACVIWISDGIDIKIVQRFAINPIFAEGTTQPGISIASQIDDENRWFANIYNTVMNGMVGFVLPIGLL